VADSTKTYRMGAVMNKEIFMNRSTLFRVVYDRLHANWRIAELGESGVLVGQLDDKTFDSLREAERECLKFNIRVTENIIERDSKRKTERDRYSSV